MSYTMEPVPILSIVGMIVALLIGVLLPVVLLVVWRKVSGAGVLHAVLGFGVFITFALILERLTHQLILGVTGDAITGNVWLYALYGGLAAGLFEETGRYLAMRFLMEKKGALTRENAVMYGIGHGGAESILILGLSMVSNLSMTVMLNAGGLENILAMVPEDMRDAYYQQISGLWTTPSGNFFLAALERISAVALHICLSYLVYRVVKGRKLAFFLFAILIHAGVDAMTVLLSGVGCPTWVLEIVLLAIVALFAFFTVRTYRAEGKAETLPSE